MHLLDVGRSRYYDIKKRRCLKEATRMPKTHKLLIDNLEERHPGLTKPIAGTLCEAARVCLDRHHRPPLLFDIERGERSSKGLTEWAVPDARTKGAWANDTDTTEAGAYGVALVVIENTDELVAVRRAETHTGADYYLGRPGEVLDDLEKSHRLEVSGVDKGNLTTLKSRLNQKVRQAKAGNSNLPAIAVVVGFSQATVLTADVDAE
jgi:hypothetical protein